MATSSPNFRALRTLLNEEVSGECVINQRRTVRSNVFYRSANVFWLLVHVNLTKYVANNCRYCAYRVSIGPNMAKTVAYKNLMLG